MEVSHKIEVVRGDVVKELLQLPEILYNLRDTIIKQEKKLTECVAIRKAVETRVSAEVHTAVDDETKKKVFANVQARSTEEKRRLEEDTEYGVAKKAEIDARAEVNVTKRDIEYVINRFKGMRTLAPLFYDEK
ncbi:hypothetical protein ACFL96_14035 [Thermoproteota archaeon]